MKDLVLIVKRYLVFITGCIFLIGCEGQQQGYLNISCPDTPQIEVFKLPKKGVYFSQGKAMLYISDLGKNFSDEWTEYLLSSVFQAFIQQGVFKDLEIGGKLKPETIDVLRQKNIDFLVLIKGVEILAPTKTVPGHFTFYLQIIEVKSGDVLLSLLGEMCISPKYPKDYVVFLTRGSFPQDDPYCLRRIFFILAKESAIVIKRVGIQSTKKLFEKSIFEDIEKEEYPSF